MNMTTSKFELNRIKIHLNLFEGFLSGNDRTAGISLYIMRIYNILHMWWKYLKFCYLNCVHVNLTAIKICGCVSYYYKIHSIPFHSVWMTTNKMICSMLNPEHCMMYDMNVFVILEFCYQFLFTSQRQKHVHTNMSYIYCLNCNRKVSHRIMSLERDCIRYWIGKEKKTYLIK